MHGFTAQIAIETIGIEGCVRSHELRHGLKTSIEGLICRLFIRIHAAPPETLAVQTYVPVTQVVLHKITDGTSCLGWFICLVGFGYVLHKRVQFGKYPTIDLRECRYTGIPGSRIPVVHVRIQCKESVGVIERAEELTAHFIHSFGIELKVLPRAGVSQHVPTNGVSTICIQCSKRIDGITQTFGHLVTVLIEHESVRDDILIGYRAFDHRVDSMERKEPTTGLVHTLGNEVGGTRGVCVLKRIVILCIRHGAGVEPHVDKVQFTFHRFAGRRNEDDIIYVRTVEIDDRGIIISFGIVTHFMLRPGVGFHEACFHRFLDFIEQFRNRTDANFFLSILGAPYR